MKKLAVNTAVWYEPTGARVRRRWRARVVGRPEPGVYALVVLNRAFAGELEPWDAPDYVPALKGFLVPDAARAELEPVDAATLIAELGRAA